MAAAGARGGALNSVGGDVDEVSRLELLLGDIRDVFDELAIKTISSAHLIEKLVEIVPRPWGEYGRSGKPLTQNKLARLLKPLGIASEHIGKDRTLAVISASVSRSPLRVILPRGGI